MFDDRLFRPYVEATSASRSRAPLYFQLFSSLKSMILEGVLGYGEQVPTEEQLASLFSVSRITSKRALDELASEGLVCLLYTSPSPRDRQKSRMPSSA